MSVDKKIDYVEQDGSLNFIKNSESVTVPKEFKARKNAPKVKLAYITDAEAKMLKKKKPGTPHKGPKGIPSYDTFGSIDSSGRDTGVSGETASGFETGFSGERGRADARAAGFSPEDVRDFRSGAIAAGAGRRVNPGFFDSRNRVSPFELARAREFNPAAFTQSRGGIMNLITGGGLLGNIIRSVGQRLGFGKRFNQPTYDMSGLSGLPLGGSAIFENLDIRDKFNRLGILSPEVIDRFGNTIGPRNVILEDEDEDEDDFFTNAMAGLTEKQKQLLDQRRGMLDALGDEAILNTIRSEDDPDDPATLQDVREYYGLA